MVNCPRCDKWFRDRYALTAHQHKLRPCEQKNVQPIESNCIPDKQKDSPDKQNALPEKQNDSSNTNNEQKNPSKISKKECQFCLHTFSLKTNMKKHNLTCKQKNDPVRIMEMEQGIKPNIPENRLECRFCNISFSKTCNLNRHITTCKERKKYLNKLEKTTPAPASTGNTINNNGTINNNNNCTFNDNRTINITFGNEDKSHITLECLFESFKQILDECPDDQTRQIALKLICIYDKKLKERPENKTMKVPNLNSMIAYIKQEAGWEMVPIDDGIHKVLKNSATGIIKHRTEMEALGKKNRLTFHGTNVQMTPQIMDEVNHIKKNGIYTEQLSGSTKTAIKITNLEN